MLHTWRHFWVCNHWNRFRLHSLYPQCFFLLVFFFFFTKQRTSFIFCGWTLSRAYICMNPPFNGPFFMTPPFSESQKVVTLPLFPPPLPPANFWQVHGLVPNTFGNAGMGIGRHVTNMVIILGTTIRNLAPIRQSGPKHSQNRPLALIGHVINAFFN